jgi:fatty-acyl-CoA synthase
LAKLTPISRRYLNRPEASEEAFEGGWFHTGDLGRIDEDGFLFLVDRKKAMIRTGAENVYAREVELTLLDHPDIRDCAVIGLPDPDYGEKVAAAVVLGENSSVTVNGLKRFVRERIAGLRRRAISSSSRSYRKHRPARSRNNWSDRCSAER